MCKWNLINKTNEQAKYNQRHGNKEQIDSNQRGERGGQWEKEAEWLSKNMCKGPIGIDNGAGRGLNVGAGGGYGGEE